MNCEEINELLAAYSLDAVAAEQAREIRAHLTSCRGHDGALAELRALTSRLPLAAGERQPPPRLRSRLLAAFDEEVAASATTRAGLASRTGRRLPLSPTGLAYLAAALLLAAVVGLTAWNLALQLGEGEPPTFAATLTGAAGTAEVVYSTTERVGVFKLDLAGLPANRVYQAWRVESSGPVSLGLVPAQGVAAFSADLSRASAVAISEEPAGGSRRPTSDPVLVAPLP